MKYFLKRLTPDRVQLYLVRSTLFFYAQKWWVRYGGRKNTSSETSKAKWRREREGFFPHYCQGNGLDIGYGGDLVCANARGWDVEDGDAMLLEGVNDECFDFVYSSHTLEHMKDLNVALKNWWRVIKPEGFLILYVPHRDLYEKKTDLPSRWNVDHKHYFLPETDEPPVTVGLLPLLQKVLGQFALIYLKVCDEGHTVSDPDRHSNGEYSIELVVRKTRAC